MTTTGKGGYRYAPGYGLAFLHQREQRRQGQGQKLSRANLENLTVEELVVLLEKERASPHMVEVEIVRLKQIHAQAALRKAEAEEKKRQRRAHRATDKVLKEYLKLEQGQIRGDMDDEEEVIGDCPGCGYPSLVLGASGFCLKCESDMELEE